MWEIRIVLEGLRRENTRPYSEPPLDVTPPALHWRSAPFLAPRQHSFDAAQMHYDFDIWSTRTGNPVDAFASL